MIPMAKWGLTPYNDKDMHIVKTMMDIAADDYYAWLDAPTMLCETDKIVYCTARRYGYEATTRCVALLVRETLQEVREAITRTAEERLKTTRRD